MDLTNKYHETYGEGENDMQVAASCEQIIREVPKKIGKELIQRIFSSIDLTSLNTQDNSVTAQNMCDKLNRFGIEFPEMPPVAAICVYPSLVPTVRKNLQASSIQLASVGACFPSSQTFLSVKLAECEMLASKGADEIDIVLSVGSFLAGNYQLVFDEIQLIKSVIGQCHLKVILETGLLQTAENIRVASFLAMEAGADFIKTSTGKIAPAATPEAVYVMARAIVDYHQQTGRQVGLKPAGGISTLEEAVKYDALVDRVLGKKWLNSSYFRIGASRLANALLSDYYEKEIVFF